MYKFTGESRIFGSAIRQEDKQIAIWRNDSQDLIEGNITQNLAQLIFEVREDLNVNRILSLPSYDLENMSEKLQLNASLKIISKSYICHNLIKYDLTFENFCPFTVSDMNITHH